MGRCFVRVGYCVFLDIVDIECSRGIVGACGGVNDGVAMNILVVAAFVKKKSEKIICSVTLATVITALIAYLQTYP